MMPIKHLSIAAIGDEELVNGLRLVGLSKYYVIKSDHDISKEVRETLSQFIVDPDIAVIVISEDYAEYVNDLLAQLREAKRMTPVIVEVPSKRGTRHQDVTEYYKAFIRKFIGFDIEI